MSIVGGRIQKDVGESDSLQMFLARHHGTKDQAFCCIQPKFVAGYLRHVVFQFGAGTQNPERCVWYLLQDTTPRGKGSWINLFGTIMTAEDKGIVR